ncbi:MAG: bacteriohemerythrin [Desulfobulbus sp.]|nr:bacteriohemerythrin [Desulfobulbus sp.]
MPINWSSDLDTGIPVIDHQHRRIVDFVNDLEAAQVLGDKKKIKSVIDDCVDYTISHFAFEESMQVEANYPYCKPHKKVHELFARKVAEYQQRIELGDDVAALSVELHNMLCRWLINHIKHDDADYVASVKANMKIETPPPTVEMKQKSWFRRLFG